MYTYVDIGNSSIKVKRPDGKTFVYNTDDFNIDSILDTCGYHEFVFASVVPKVLNKIINSPNLSNKKYRVIDTRSNLSFSHDLEGVGIDRLLVVEGALTISFPPFVVIDAGTAITVDIVVSKRGNTYLAGGTIIPGFSLGLKSLSDYTSQLPSLTPIKPSGIIGSSTEDAIMSGVCHSVVKGVEGIIEKAKLEFNTPDFQLFITGGYAKFFMELSSLNFIYVDDLVFRGMECVSL